jgi:hypothetical protein
LPKRTVTEYVVQDWTLTSVVGWVLGDVEATVAVGVVLVVEVVPALFAPPDDEVLPVELPVAVPVAGVGDTIETVEEPDDGVLPVDEDDEVPEDEPVAGAVEPGLALSFGTLAANGSRAIRARSTLAGALDGDLVVDVWLEVALVTVSAAGGAGRVGAPPADALLSRSTGTATTAASSTATMIQSLRSSRSRRSERITGLRWSKADRAKR